MIEIEEEEPPKLDIAIPEEEEPSDKPENFLNTIMCMTTSQTMRVMEKIGEIPLTALINTGSTHNFLHGQFAKLAGLQTESNSTLRVLVANKEKVKSLGLCREVTLNLQNL